MIPVVDATGKLYPSFLKSTTMLQKIVATAMFTYAVFVCPAQVNYILALTDTLVSGSVPDEMAPPKKSLRISGSADVYYRYDLHEQGNNYTSFTNTHNSFALGMASLKFAYESGKTTAVADLGFGARASDFAYNDEGLLSAVKQLYVSYKATPELSFTAGTWATHVGYELLDPQLNRQYSMSYLFTNGPFSHTGLKAEYAKGRHGLMLGVSNATDYRLQPVGFQNKKSVIAQYSIAASDDVKLYFNYVGGKNPDTTIVKQYDLVATAVISSMVDVGFNASLNSSQQWDAVSKKNATAQNWWGVAGYLNVNPKSWFSICFRSEFFNDDEAVKGFNTSIFSNTLSANFKVDGLIFIPEIRVESAGKALYTDSNGFYNKKTATSFILAAVYSF